MNPNNNLLAGRARAPIKIEDTKEVVCEKCGHDVFQFGAFMRSVSPILTGATKTTYVPVETTYCIKCGHANDEFRPVELKKVTLIP